MLIKGPYQSFCMFEPNIFNFLANFHSIFFPKDKTDILQKSLNLLKANIQAIHPP
ncbi:hypothetical protein LDENG_00099710 [Lucifuga dentata]|nr:hypothetical protein LDENG_00099710 [Lucifuga dentata]